MGWNLPRPSAGGDFEPVPEGLHTALCYRIIDLGTQPTTYMGEPRPKHQIILSFELHSEGCHLDDGRPMSINTRALTFSMHEKSILRQHLTKWRGKAFTDADFGDNGFDVRKLIGAPCLLQVVHNPSRDGTRTFANIEGITQLPKQMPKPGKLYNEAAVICLEPGEFDAAAYAKLPDWLKEKIADSPEYQKLQRPASSASSSTSTSRAPARNGRISQEERDAGAEWERERVDAGADDIPF